MAKITGNVPTAEEKCHTAVEKRGYDKTKLRPSCDVSDIRRDVSKILSSSGMLHSAD